MHCLSPSSSPQALYLRAGGFERDSEMDSARRVYEYLIVTFPKSSWAVKANDRLLAMKAEGAAAERARPASSRSNPTVAPDRRNGNAAAAVWALEDERQRQQEQSRQNAERAEKERQQREREEAESFRQRNEQIRRQQEQWAEEERRRRQ